MSSRAIAGRVSAVLSLGLIAMIAIAYLGDPRPRPLAVPASKTMTAAAFPARPQVMATLPVVLPPPPARTPTAKAAPEPEAPRSTEAERKAVAVESARSPVPKAPAPAIATTAGASQPRRQEPKPAAEPGPSHRTPRDNSVQPSLSERPRPAAKTATAGMSGRTIAASRKHAAEGRTLLRLLEHGSGPTIELAWPGTARQRENLFDLLGGCYGMQVALMDRKDRLFIASGRRTVPWALNLDRFSGFLREPAGVISRQERRAAEQIRAHHGGLRNAVPVRIFRRDVDARLLGGLRRLIGGSYPRVQAIRARYRARGRQLVVEDIVADGRAIPGRLELPPVARGACRRPTRQ